MNCTAGPKRTLRIAQRSPAMENDAGSALVLVLAACAVVALVAGVVMAAGQLMWQRSQAQAIADMAALAGANELNNGMGQACAIVRETAARNGLASAAVTCAIESANVRVGVRVGRTYAAALAGPNP